jgi:hypothetical protein
MEVTLTGRNLQDAKSAAFLSGKLKRTLLSTSLYEPHIRVERPRMSITAASAQRPASGLFSV